MANIKFFREALGLSRAVIRKHAKREFNVENLNALKYWQWFAIEQALKNVYERRNCSEQKPIAA